MTTDIQDILEKYRYININHLQEGRSLLYTIIEWHMCDLKVVDFQIALNQKVADVKLLVNELVKKEQVDNINYPKQSSNTTALFLATKFAVRLKHLPQFEEILKILINAGADTNIADSSGNTPLHIAVQQGDFQITQTLMDAGADTNIADSSGNTPLHIAVQQGDFQITQTLIDAGADIERMDGIGRTPLIIAVRQNNTAMIEFIEVKLFVKAILQKFGYSNVDEIRGEQSLLYSVLHDTQISENQTKAEFFKQKLDEVKTILVAYTENIDHYNGSDNSKTTALHLATSIAIMTADKNCFEIVKLLLDCKADVNITNSAGMTPIECAIKAKNFELQEKLEEYDVVVKHKISQSSPKPSLTRQKLSEATTQLTELTSTREPIFDKFQHAFKSLSIVEPLATNPELIGETSTS